MQNSSEPNINLVEYPNSIHALFWQSNAPQFDATVFQNGIVAHFGHMRLQLSIVYLANVAHTVGFDLCTVSAVGETKLQNYL